MTMADNGWKHTGFIAVAVLFAGIVAWEALFAALGGSRQPVADTPQLWAQWRERATQARPQDFVLVGASRMQLDVDLATLERVTGRRAFQLAIDGSSFIPVLADLAQDPRIRATVLVSVRPPDLAGGGFERAQEMVGFYHHWSKQRWQSPSDFTERRLEALLYRLVPSREQGVRPGTVFALLYHDRRISSYLATYPSREREADYTLINVGALRQARYEGSLRWYERSAAVPYETVERNLAALRSMVGMIRARGGDVVFIRFPISTELLEATEQYLPYERYLGRVARETGARVIEFDRYPSLRGFDTPDGSHLDVREQAAFTAELAKILLE